MENRASKTFGKYSRGHDDVKVFISVEDVVPHVPAVLHGSCMEREPHPSSQLLVSVWFHGNSYFVAFVQLN